MPEADTAARLAEKLRIAGQLDKLPAMLSVGQRVITSYSIHYTKLYESWPGAVSPTKTAAVPLTNCS